MNETRRIRCKSNLRQSVRIIRFLKKSQFWIVVNLVQTNQEHPLFTASWSSESFSLTKRPSIYLTHFCNELRASPSTVLQTYTEKNVSLSILKEVRSKLILNWFRVPKRKFDTTVEVNSTSNCSFRASSPLQLFNLTVMSNNHLPNSVLLSLLSVLLQLKAGI